VQTKFRPKVAFALRWLAALLLTSSSTFAQESRISGPIDSTQTVTLKGNVNPKAQARYDLGPVDPAFKLNYITLALKPSANQQAALEQLLSEQQDRLSPNYHRWLTPEQYADKFGLSAGDVAKVHAWLESEGFTINLRSAWTELDCV
jgi:subtilase family serine protease